MKEAEVLEAALGMTKVHYWNLTGEFAQSPPPLQNYMLQWQFIQDQLCAYWINAELSGDPPTLFILGSWSGGLESWGYP